jgi:multidrug transporter EmrE-like cation transporter
MSVGVRILILSAVALSAFAQIALKHGMSRPEVQKALASMQYPKVIIEIVANSGVICGILMYVAGMVLWLFVLAKIDVSQAYPFVGIGFVITMSLGYLLFGETLSIYRISGALFVAIGIMLISHQ